ncbi:MAG: DUF1326 domain-containing protein [Pseudomonadota bacterium]
MPGAREDGPPRIEWAIKGELFLNCSCTVFCPCVVSLGAHPPTEGHCHAWMAIIIDKGHYGEADLTGLNVGLLVDIPGRMGEGNWKVGLYVDEAASDEAFTGIGQILSGKAGGTTGLLSMLVGEVLGAERTPVVIERDGHTRRITVGKKLQGEIEHVLGHEDQPVIVKNTRYWMGPDIFVARGTKSRLRDRGRVWDFGGKSAEICPIDWHGPGR